MISKLVFKCHVCKITVEHASLMAIENEKQMKIVLKQYNWYMEKKEKRYHFYCPEHIPMYAYFVYNKDQNWGYLFHTQTPEQARQKYTKVELESLYRDIKTRRIYFFDNKIIEGHHICDCSLCDPYKSTPRKSKIGYIKETNSYYLKEDSDERLIKNENVTS
jgi:hypothetical protein